MIFEGIASTRRSDNGRRQVGDGVNVKRQRGVRHDVVAEFSEIPAPRAGGRRLSVAEHDNERSRWRGVFKKLRGPKGN